ncbi:hypothetical protein [Phenylobacterium sp.]|jgi:hypothetical protein|uniref:hypothetical protein n=1 Tax=Phenylobacterium sp. TaxID=1871053 RepID=UPI002F4042ED
MGALQDLEPRTHTNTLIRLASVYSVVRLRLRRCRGVGEDWLGMAATPDRRYGRRMTFRDALTGFLGRLLRLIALGLLVMIGAVVLVLDLHAPGWTLFAWFFVVCCLGSLLEWLERRGPKDRRR